MDGTDFTQGSVHTETFMILLKRHRIAAGFTQTKLAKTLNLVPSTISQWESGKSRPHPSVIPKLAQLFGLRPIDLTRVLDPEPAAPLLQP